MAPPYPTPTPTPRRGSEFTPRDETDLISRLHSDALDTPVSLTRRLAKSRTTHARVNPNLSSSDSEGDANAESSLQQNRGRQPNHSRSMSNPFPSLFNGRRRQGSASKPSVDVDRAAGGPAPSNRPVQTHRRGNPSMSKDFATGNCMTCASLVKWPKELKVFKCTICMTINDLVPISVDSQGSKQQRHDTSPGPSSSSSKQPPHSPGMAPGQGPRTSPFGQLNMPISLDQTKHLIRQNLRSYVLRRLRDLSAETQVEQTGDDWPLRQDRLHPDLAIRTHGPLDITPVRKGSVTKYTFDEEPTLHPNTASANPPIAMSRSYPSSSNEQPGLRGPPPNSNHNHVSPRPRDRSAGPPDDPRKIFKQLEDYITNCFNNFECINSSFSTQHPRYASRSASDTPRRPSVPSRDVRQPAQIKSAPRRPSQLEVDSPIVDLDPKLLLLGDVAENGLWWTGQDTMAPKKTPNKEEPVSVHVHRPSPQTRSPQLNWADIDEWYSIVNNAAEGWFQIYEEVSADLSLGHLAEQELRAIEQDVLKGQDHTQRLLLKVTENLLKRPGRPIKDPMDLRFLLIIMENPSLHSDNESFKGLLQPETTQPIRSRPTDVNRPAGNTGLLSGQHSGIVKRILGLISNASPECQNQMITWLARYHAARFIKVKELASGFLTYRMIRQSEKKQTEHAIDPTAGLIPQMRAGRNGGASLHDAIGGPRPTKKSKEPPKVISYSDDWQIKAASRVLSLLFSANIRRGEDVHPNSQVTWNGASRVGGYFLPPTDFYNSMIDYADLIDDFESWESKRSKFSFCQYPFLLSVWAKTHILEHDARRQMQSKARDAFFDSIMTRRNINQYLVLDVRRDCLVDDSLTAVSSVIGSGGEDLKKGLRISFQGEEGIDAGGLRKEWFLLLIREVFNPDYGMFIYDDDSQYCYFNSNSFEPADQFFLVGVVMGLAIYNSTILDVALPPFAFRKLIASAPSPPGSIIQHRPPMRYTLDDLAEYRPRLANGLKQLLAFDGDVEETFCLDFVIETDRYGSKVQVPLCPGGESKPVTNENRREYVDLYVRHVLDIAVKRQFEPFKRGFYTVCGGNAFSLFRPEEIELLIRGSDEPLDIASLRAVAEYDNWESKQPEVTEPVIGWFWETFQQATPSDQRKLLTFVTGSDRIPAMGAASLTIKLSCLGDDCGRYPIARTCFNMLSLWRYASKERLESMLWRAVHESEGFGLK